MLDFSHVSDSTTDLTNVNVNNLVGQFCYSSGPAGDTRQHVHFHDLTVTNSKAMAKSIIELSGENTDFDITGATFDNNWIKGEAPITTSREKAVARYTNMVIKRTYANRASTLKALTDSNIICDNCTLEENFSLSAGVFLAEGNGYVTMIDSTI